MKFKPWAPGRVLTDEAIREIARTGRAAPKGARLSLYRALARQYGCGASTVGRIVNGWILPKEVAPSPQSR